MRTTQQFSVTLTNEMAALVRAKAHGLVRHIGVTGHAEDFVVVLLGSHSVIANCRLPSAN